MISTKERTKKILTDEERLRINRDELPRGLFIDKSMDLRSRIKHKGRWFEDHIGKWGTPGLLALAHSKHNAKREAARLGKLGIEDGVTRWNMRQGADFYFEKIASKKPGRGAPEQRAMLDLILLCPNTHAEKLICDVLPEDVRAFREWRRKNNFRHPGEPVSASTVNRSHTTLNAMLNGLDRLQAEGSIRPNVLLFKRNPAKYVGKENEDLLRRKRILSDDERERLMNAADPQMRRIIIGNLCMALRKSELEGLTMDSIDKENNVLVGRISKSKVGHERQFRVKITPVVQALIDSRPGHNIFDFTNFKKRWIATATAAGLYRDFQFKDLRKSAANWLHTSGIEIGTIQETLNHADITTTQIYLAVQSKDKARAADVLGAKFGFEILQSADKSVSKSVSKVLENGEYGSKVSVVK